MADELRQWIPAGFTDHSDGDGQGTHVPSRVKSGHLSRLLLFQDLSHRKGGIFATVEIDFGAIEFLLTGDYVRL